MSETIKFLYGKDQNLNTRGSSSTKGSLYLSTVEKLINSQEKEVKSYLYFDNGIDKLNIVPKLLDVENGGTGLTTLEQGKALIGSGTSSVTFRNIVNSSTPCSVNGTDSLITENTLGYWTGEFKASETETKYCLSKLGTVTIGTWTADIIKTLYGGTGNSEFTNNRLLQSIQSNSETQLVSTNHYIDDTKTILFYDKDYIYSPLSTSAHLTVDGTVDFFTSKNSEKNRNIKFEFNEHELVIQSPLTYATSGQREHNTLIYEDATPSLVFFQKESSEEYKGALKWGNNSKHGYNGLQLVSNEDDIDLVFLAPELETNSITHFSIGDSGGNTGTRKKVLQFFNAKTVDNSNKSLYCSGVSLGGGGPTYITGGAYSDIAVEEAIQEEKEENNFVIDQSIFCLSDDAITFSVGRGKVKTEASPWMPCITLDKDGNFYPDIDDTCSIGTDAYNWSTIKALNLLANSKLTIKAKDKVDSNGNVQTNGDIQVESGTNGNIEIKTGQNGEIFLNAGTQNIPTIKKIHLNNLTYIKNNLILTGDIKYHNLEDSENLDQNSHSMIRFLRGTTSQAGISIGGKGMVAIGSGESIDKIENELCADPLQGGLINGVDSTNISNHKKNKQVYIASDQNIYFYPYREESNVGLSEYLEINTNKTLTSSEDKEWYLGAKNTQWKDIWSYRLTSKEDLILQAGDFLAATNPVNKKIELNSYQTNVLGKLYLYDDIYYNNGGTPLKVIDFTAGTALGTGVAIGGQGSIFIAAGEAISNAAALSITQGDNDQMYLASDGDITLFTSAELNSTTVKKTVLDTFGNITLKSTDRGYYLTDSKANEYPGIVDNGTDLWIGAYNGTSKSHVGQTIISTGFNGSNAGNATILVAVPNNTNSGSTTYKVFHENTTVPVTSGGTGKRSWNANRLIWTSGTTTLSDSGHYVSSTQMAINTTTAQAENFYVKGTSKFTGAMEVNDMIKIKAEASTGLNGDGVSQTQTSKVLEIYGTHYPGQGSAKNIDHNTAGPKIRFKSQDNQTVSLVFTGYDTAPGKPSGPSNWGTLGLVGDSSVTPIFYSPYIQTEHITFNNNGNARHMITFQQGLNADGTDNSSYGAGIVIGAGGRVVIGGGESARQFLKTKFPGYDANGNDTKITTSTEHLFLTSDQYIQFFPGGNGWQDDEKLTEVSRIIMSRVDADFGSQIKRQVAAGSSWWQGRKSALLRSTDDESKLSSGNYYQALTSMKTRDGSWESGVWAGQTGDANAFVLSYTPDQCFDGGANNKTVNSVAYSCKQPFKALSSGAIAVSNYSTSAPSSTTPGYGVPGALYFKIV